MTQTIRLAISTCPNDTFAFHALMQGFVPTPGLKLDFQLLDIEQLNSLAAQKQADIAKASFAAAVGMSRDYWVLPSGSALGFGVGPLLLAAEANTTPCESSQTTLCPGKQTTAALLFDMFYPQSTHVEQVVFSDIMPGLRRGEADFGVCIHEGRFTWQEQGLFLVEDLGTRWEQETNCPLPLGGILAAKSLSIKTVDTMQRAIRQSIEFAVENPSLALPTMRKYAQEFNDDILMQHVDLYVNEWTLDLGTTGRRALDEFSTRAKAVRHIDVASQLDVFATRG